MHTHMYIERKKEKRKKAVKSEEITKIQFMNKKESLNEGKINSNIKRVNIKLKSIKERKKQRKKYDDIKVKMKKNECLID